MTKKEKNNYVLLGSIFISLFLSNICEWFITKSDGGYQITLLPVFVIGILSAILIYFYIGIEDEMLKLHSLAPFYMIPTFLLLMLSRFNASRTPSGLFGVTKEETGILKWMLQNNINLEKYAVWKPTYGFITEFLFGLFLTLAIIILISAIKNKTIKELFFFNPKHLWYLLVPLGISYIDSFASIGFYLNQTILLKPSKWYTDLAFYGGGFILLMLIFATCAYGVFMISKRIELDRWASITGIVSSSMLGVLRLIFAWIFSSSGNNEDPTMLDWFMGKLFDFNYPLTIMMAVILAISIKALFKTDFKFNLHIMIGNKNNDRI